MSLLEALSTWLLPGSGRIVELFAITSLGLIHSQARCMKLQRACQHCNAYQVMHSCLM